MPKPGQTAVGESQSRVAWMEEKVWGAAGMQ